MPRRSQGCERRDCVVVDQILETIPLNQFGSSTFRPDTIIPIRSRDQINIGETSGKKTCRHFAENEASITNLVEACLNTSRDMYSDRV